MLAHAIDNPAPSTVVLISGDRDFAYALSILRLRQYHVVLITLSNAHPSLRVQASLCFDWVADVLGPPVDTTLFHQPTSPHRGKPSAPPAHDNLSSDSKGHNSLRSPFQESYDEQPKGSVEFINCLQDKTKCRESPRTPPKHDAKHDYLPPPDLEPPERQPATASAASSALRNGPEAPTRVLYSPVASHCHTHLNGDIKPPLTTHGPSNASQTTLIPNSSAGSTPKLSADGSTEPPYDLSNSSQTTLTPNSSAGNTPRLSAYGSIMASKFSAYSCLRGSFSLPNLVPPDEIASVSDHPVPFESAMRIPPADPDLRGPPLPPPSSQQQGAYALNNAKCQQSLFSVDDDDGDPDLPPTHWNLPVTTPLPAPTPSFIPSSSMPSRPTVSPMAQSSVKVAHPLPEPAPPPTVPDKFKILVQCLRSHRSTGSIRPLRSLVSAEIFLKGTTYRQAGVSKFRDYVAMAEKAGVVDLGGFAGKAWIALREPCVL